MPKTLLFSEGHKRIDSSTIPPLFIITAIVPYLGTFSPYFTLSTMYKTIHSEPYKALIGWLKACRKSKKLDMRTLAKLLNLPHSWIGKIETRERRLDLAEYVRLCQALNINPHTGLDLLISAMDKSSSAPKKKQTPKIIKK